MNVRNVPQLFSQLETELMIKKEHKKKDSFWASDCEKGALDIYLKFKGVRETNPPELSNNIVMLTGKKIEEAIVDLCINSDSIRVVKPKEGDQFRVDMEREGQRITGYIDMVIKETVMKSIGKTKTKDILVPVEIKSCYGFASSKYEQGDAQTHHLKQLAVYMDFMGVDKGYVLYVARDTGGMWLIPLIRNKDETFTSGQHTFDINDEYIKWDNLMTKYIKNDIEPKNDYYYKTPMDKIDWDSLKKSEISSARTGKAVIGDWQVKYSAYKNYIIKKEAEARKKNPATYIGYTDMEKAYICEKTKGYSSKK